MEAEAGGEAAPEPPANPAGASRARSPKLVVVEDTVPTAGEAGEGVAPAKAAKKATSRKAAGKKAAGKVKRAVRGAGCGQVDQSALPAPVLAI